MYEARYARYFTQSEARFAEQEEIEAVTTKVTADRLQAAGTPLAYRDGRYYLDNSDNHSLIVGPTGCKKSRATVVPTLFSIIANHESAVVNDPKLEIYRKTAAAARKAGAQVFVLNLRDPKHSHGWNPLRLAYRFYEQGKLDEAQQAISDFAECVVAPALEKTVDRYWGDLSGSSIKGVCMMYMQTVPKRYFHLKNIIPFLYEDRFDLLRKLASKMDPLSPATFNLKCLTALEAEKTKTCIYSTLLSLLAPFVQNQSLLDMLCTSSFDFEELGTRQTIIYLAYPDERTALNFLATSFYTQCYEALVSFAGTQPEDSLPVRVNFVLDEISNLAPLLSFSNRVSEARSKNIRFFLYGQSFGQLQEKYGEVAESILTNCGNWVVFSSKETGFLQKLSDICGREVDYNGLEHPLVSAYTLQHLQKKTESAEVLVIKQGLYPFITELPDYEYQTVFPVSPTETVLKVSMPKDAPVLTIEKWIDYVDEGENGFCFPYAS